MLHKLALILITIMLLPITLPFMLCGIIYLFFTHEKGEDFARAVERLIKKSARIEINLEPPGEDE